VPTSPTGMVASEIYVASPSSSSSSNLCSPTAVPRSTQGAAMGSTVPSWLRGSDVPISGEDLAARLRAVAPEAYED